MSITIQINQGGKWGHCQPQHRAAEL